AMVCKDLPQCEAVMGALAPAGAYGPDCGGLGSPRLISGKDKEYKGGFVVIPSYLSKGLEFDAVAVLGADEPSYPGSELDVKLLYVSMTRALHALALIWHGTPSPLIAGLL
ncbi:MAG: ATP-binding domain-containing protein, partial [Oscillospiraceae bacterium]|nr:ATP-binding domain-containing protein [Oscillospiraceae bacterium]